MKRVRLGKTDMYVNAIGLGCMGLTHASGLPTPKEEAVEILRKAHDMGYDFYDTAECYTGVNPDGSTAYNEEVVGEAVKPFRKDIILCTKFGVKHMGDHLEFDSSPETIRKSLEESLKKLQTDYVDIYYQHRIDPKVEPEVVAGVMKELIEEGKIKAWGEGKFVAKETGKGLSTNDYTNADKTKLNGVATGAQANKIETVKVNGTALTPDSSKAVNVDLSAYAKSADVTKEIASAVSGVTQIDYSVVESLPSTGKKGIIYLVANSGTGTNIYDEYIYINSKFEKLGSREMDLSSYAKKTDIPTKVSSLTNDSGYQTAAQVTSAINAKLVVMTDTELNTMWTEVFGA